MLLVVVAVLSVAAASEFVATPFGLRLRQCVTTASVVHEQAEPGVLLLDRRVRTVVPAVCRTEASWQRAPKTRTAPWGPDNYTCASLPCNDWLDNAGWMDEKATLRGFAGIYMPPQLPAVSAGQTIFYFLGLENTDDVARHGHNRVILQPVLTYGNGQPTDSWYMQSWACCPQGMTVSSPPLMGILPMQVITTFANKTSETEAVVSSAITAVNASIATTLNIYLNGPPHFEDRHFNWADLTLEVYTVQNCSCLPKGPMFFKQLSLWDASYKPIAFPSQWSITSNKPCGGVTTVSGNSATISHN